MFRLLFTLTCVVRTFAFGRSILLLLLVKPKGLSEVQIIWFLTSGIFWATKKPVVVDNLLGLSCFTTELH